MFIDSGRFRSAAGTAETDRNGLGRSLSAFQCIINAFARHRIDKTGGIACQQYVFNGSFSRKGAQGEGPALETAFNHIGSGQLFSGIGIIFQEGFKHLAKSLGLGKAGAHTDTDICLFRATGKDPGISGQNRLLLVKFCRMFKAFDVFEIGSYGKSTMSGHLVQQAQLTGDNRVTPVRGYNIFSFNLLIGAIMYAGNP